MTRATSSTVAKGAPALSESEERSIAATVLLVANLIRRSANITYGTELELSPVEWSMIARLGQNGPMTQTEIAERYLYDKGQLSRAAARLARKRLIVREGRTWRSFQLRLAPAGSEVYAKIMRWSRVRNKALSVGIGARELHNFLEILDRIAINANSLLQSVKSQGNEDS